MAASFLTVLTAIGVAGGLAGTAVQMAGQKRAAAAQDAALQEQQKAEALRREAMNVDAERRKRAIIRQSIAARSQAVAAASASGAMQGSGLPGAIGGISGQTTENLNTVSGNQAFGNEMFGINNAMLNNYRDAASASSMSATGAGISSLAGGLVSGASTFNRVGTYFANQFRGFNSNYGSGTSDGAIF